MTTESLLVLAGILALCSAARGFPAALRQWVLLGASYVAYAYWAGFPFLLLLIASSVVNYSWGAVLRRRTTIAMLWTGIALNVFLLAFFKYLPALTEAWPEATWGSDVVRKIILPLGISFWTFQGLSYLFDVYREEEMDPSLREFCLYMAFWPTVVSGPVSRLPMMLPQFRQLNGKLAEDLPVGVVRLIQGLFMKFVLAHLLSVGLVPDGGVTAGFDGFAPRRSGLDVWALGIGFGLQIFFDFAGYSNMVIGAARMMGIRLPENFTRPYLSVTPSIFWTRWHMSLSFWIRDYVFMPLATLRREPWWLYAALVLSMIIFGLWHDAKLTFVLWGFFHGLLLVGHRLGQQLNRRLGSSPPSPAGSLLSWFATSLLISLSWIFFRANDANQALQMIAAVVTPWSYSLSSLTLRREYYVLVALMGAGYFGYVGAAQLVLSWRVYLDKRRSFGRTDARSKAQAGAPERALLYVDGVLVENRWWWLTPALALVLMVTTLSLFGQTSNIAPFIYTLF